MNEVRKITDGRSLPEKKIKIETWSKEGREKLKDKRNKFRNKANARKKN